MLRFLLPLVMAVLYSIPVFAETAPAAMPAVSAATPPPANGKAWALESSIRRVLEIAPERRQSEAAIEARRMELDQAGRWPNPSVDLRADNKIGQLSGQGGNKLAQLSLAQPLPIRRLGYQRAAAESGLAAAQAGGREQFLLLERETARVFHASQFATAKHQLAHERLQLTNSFAAGKIATKGDRIKRYLTPLETGRLALLQEEAHQADILAERDLENAQIGFKSLLVLNGKDSPETMPLILPEYPAAFAVLADKLDLHPAVEAARRETESAEMGIKVAESRRYADPVLKLFHDRDYNNGATMNITGIGVGIEIPVWSRNRAMEGKARADANASRAHYEVLRRDAKTRLEQAYAQLVRLQDQTRLMEEYLIEPARKMFELTRRSFAAGESNVLALVDASHAYFDARTRYLELLHECALASAEVRFAAGLSVVDLKEYQP
ncbi:MAG: TolC family protein [Nitrosomonadales bacterium]|nr:TolC family protein [Nitrosomonadales bacterium]